MSHPPSLEVKIYCAKCQNHSVTRAGTDSCPMCGFPVLSPVAQAAALRRHQEYKEVEKLRRKGT